MAVRRAATIPDVAEDEASKIRSQRLAAAAITGLPVRTHKTDGGGNGPPVDKRWRIGGYRARVVLTDVLIVVATTSLVSIARFGIEDSAKLASSSTG